MTWTLYPEKYWLGCLATYKISTKENAMSCVPLSSCFISQLRHPPGEDIYSKEPLEVNSFWMSESHAGDFRASQIMLDSFVPMNRQ